MAKKKTQKKVKCIVSLGPFDLHLSRCSMPCPSATPVVCEIISMEWPTTALSMGLPQTGLQTKGFENIGLMEVKGVCVTDCEWRRIKSPSWTGNGNIIISK